MTCRSRARRQQPDRTPSGTRPRSDAWRARACWARSSSGTTSSSTGRWPRWSSTASSSRPSTRWSARMIAFATFAAGFVTRPLGGFIFGHFGDRVGRKKMLVLTMLIMGLSTFAMGLLPTYASIGVCGAHAAAPPADAAGHRPGRRVGRGRPAVRGARTRRPPRLVLVVAPARRADRPADLHPRGDRGDPAARGGVPVVGLARALPRLDRPGRGRPGDPAQDRRAAGVQGDRGGRRDGRAPARRGVPQVPQGHPAGDGRPGERERHVQHLQRLPRHLHRHRARPRRVGGARRPAGRLRRRLRRDPGRRPPLGPLRPAPGLRDRRRPRPGQRRADLRAGQHRERRADHARCRRRVGPGRLHHVRPRGRDVRRGVPHPRALLRHERGLPDRRHPDRRRRAAHRHLAGERVERLGVAGGGLRDGDGRDLARLGALPAGDPPPRPA